MNVWGGGGGLLNICNEVQGAISQWRSSTGVVCLGNGVTIIYLYSNYLNHENAAWHSPTPEERGEPTPYQYWCKQSASIILVMS